MHTLNKYEIGHIWVTNDLAPDSYILATMQHHKDSYSLWRQVLLVLVTLGTVVLCGAIVFIALLAASFTANGAYKAVALFLAIILDSNLLSIYFRWVIAL